MYTGIEKENKGVAKMEEFLQKAGVKMTKKSICYKKDRKNSHS